MKALFAHDHRIYHCNDDYYSSGGLSKQAIERYTNVFENLIVTSRQVSINKINEKMTLSSNNNTEFVKVPDLNNIPSRKKISKATKIMKEKVIESDYIIARLPSVIGNIAIHYAKKYNKPYLIEVVGCAWDAHWNHSLKGKIVAPYMYYLTRRRVSEADYVIYVTNEFLQRRYPTEGKSTNCSNVSLTQFDDETLTNRINKIKSTTENNKIIIGTAAAVDVKYKGQQYIIEALGKLKKKGNTNFEYQIVGNGNPVYLKSIAEKYDVVDQVKLLGSLPHEEVFNWLDEIDIYTQPSRQEGLPRALIEAMSRGLPAFGARTAGIPELLESDFIFSNTRKNINEICEILLSFDKKVMIEKANRNYEESKKYDKNIIEQRRKGFFEEFKKDSIKV